MVELDRGDKGGMAAPNRIQIGDTLGDGSVLRLLPGGLRNAVRRLGVRRPKPRERRLMRVAAGIFPAIQNIEMMAVADGQQLLVGKTFDECCRDAKCIERALTLFEVAWQTGLTDLRPSATAAPLPWGNTRTPLGACGLSVGQGQQVFLKMAVALIFKDNRQAYERLIKFIDEKSSLARMRLLSSIDPLSLAELQTGWGRRFAELLTTKDDHYAAAVRRLKPFQVRSMRQVMEAKFVNCLEWPPDMVDAVSESFQCVEQFRDLGDFFIMLTTTEAIHAIGRWERRDITTHVNAERKKQGKAPLKGRRWDTDIAHIKRVLGTQFGILLERDAGLIDLFGELYASRIRLLSEPQRGTAIEQFQLLAKRYLAYLTSPMLEALMRPEGADGEELNFAEMIGVLEGLFMKNGLGTGFFEGAFQTEEGVRAVRNLIGEYIDMKRRGAAKANTDVAALVRDSDLFDRHLVPLMGRKKKPLPA